MLDDQRLVDDEVADVRILVIGDQGVGKTSLVTALLDDQFPESVPARIETILIPPDVTPDGVVTEIIDYSSREQDEEDLAKQIQRANAYCLIFNVGDQRTFDRITSYWLPLIQSTLGGGEHGRPVIVAANKSDDADFPKLDNMVPIMNQYYEVETVVECSARTMKNVSEIFYYAQKAVLYPFRPLYRVEHQELSPKCKKALVRIFKLSDYDNDGLLSDEELKKFQVRCFGVPLTAAGAQEVKEAVLEYDAEAVLENSLTLRGFLLLHQLFIMKGRHETAWTVLKKFGYDRNLQLTEEYLYPSIRIPKGSSTELSATGQSFLTALFRKYDEDLDECLSPTELQNLFSVCPSLPWTKQSLQSVETNSRGWSFPQALHSQHWFFCRITEILPTSMGSMTSGGSIGSLGSMPGGSTWPLCR
ncbi:EF hand family protein [Aphelenchoides avenae]|nr:EF hand family protein [Aphelenchus avenae]